MLGYLDDVILLPVLIWMIVRLLSQAVLSDCRAQADEWLRANRAKPASRLGAALITLLWIATEMAIWVWVSRQLCPERGHVIRCGRPESDAGCQRTARIGTISPRARVKNAIRTH